MNPFEAQWEGRTTTDLMIVAKVMKASHPLSSSVAPYLRETWGLVSCLGFAFTLTRKGAVKNIVAFLEERPVLHAGGLPIR